MCVKKLWKSCAEFFKISILHLRFGSKNPVRSTRNRRKNRCCLFDLVEFDLILVSPRDIAVRHLIDKVTTVPLNYQIEHIQGVTMKPLGTP